MADQLAPIRAWIADTERRPANDDELAEYLAEFALDQAAEELVAACGIKSLTTEDGQIVLELAPARELVLVWCAAVRTMLDEHEAVNYTESEITMPLVSMDLQDGQHGADAYTLTLQRRCRPTPHALRQKAERERDEALAEVARLTALNGRPKRSKGH
jgi:hypothetical protein